MTDDEIKAEILRRIRAGEDYNVVRVAIGLSMVNLLKLLEADRTFMVQVLDCLND